MQGADGRGGVASGGSAQAPSIRDRLHRLLGWKTGPAGQRAAARGTPRAAEAAKTELRAHAGVPAPSQDGSPIDRDRMNLPRLRSPAIGPTKPLGILTMLEQFDSGGHLGQAGDSHSVRSWKALAQTSLGIDFERTVADLSKQKTQQLAALRADIARLPADECRHYQSLLSDILACHNSAERGTMLIELADDVAACHGSKR